MIKEFHPSTSDDFLNKLKNRFTGQVPAAEQPPTTAPEATASVQPTPPEPLEEPTTTPKGDDMAEITIGQQDLAPNIQPAAPEINSPLEQATKAKALFHQENFFDTQADGTLNDKTNPDSMKTTMTGFAALMADEYASHFPDVDKGIIQKYFTEAVLTHTTLIQKSETTGQWEYVVKQNIDAALDDHGIPSGKEAEAMRAQHYGYVARHLSNQAGGSFTALRDAFIANPTLLAEATDANFSAIATAGGSRLEDVKRILTEESWHLVTPGQEVEKFLFLNAPGLIAGEQTLKFGQEVLHMTEAEIIALFEKDQAEQIRLTQEGTEAEKKLFKFAAMIAKTIWTNGALGTGLAERAPKRFDPRLRDIVTTFDDMIEIKKKNEGEAAAVIEAVKDLDQVGTYIAMKHRLTSSVTEEPAGVFPDVTAQPAVAQPTEKTA